MKNVLRHLFSWSLGILWVLPFVGIFMASIRPETEIVHGWWVFEEFRPTISNYIEVLLRTSLPLLRPLWNSLYISIWGTIVPMILGGFAGYAFARHKIPFKKTIIVALLSLMAIPLQMISVPVFRIMNSLRLLDTFTSVIIMDTATALPWIIFFMMNFVRSQPIEVEESAKIDGASSLQIVLHIVLPQSIPALISVFTLQFVWCWVDFFLPLIFLYTPEKYVSIQVIPMLRGQFVENWGQLSAAAVLVTAMPFLLFMFLQKYYIKGSVGWIAEK
jgi:multiple sugar transport system permease protein